MSTSQSFVSQVDKNIHKHDKISALHARALFMSSMVTRARRTHCALYTSTTNTRHRVVQVWRWCYYKGPQLRSCLPFSVFALFVLITRM